MTRPITATPAATGGVKAELVVENKNNTVFQKAFITQIKGDIRRHGTEHGILSVKTMPAEHRTDDYFEQDGIMVVHVRPTPLTGP